VLDVVFDKETKYFIFVMDQSKLILPETLQRVIFAVLPLSGFIFGSSLLTGVGIRAARGIGQSINGDDEIDGGVRIFSSETSVFSSFAATLASHCESRWSDSICPHSTIDAGVMRPLVHDSRDGEIARREFFTKLIPTSGMMDSVRCLVLVVSEAQSFVLPRTFCKMIGVRYEQNNSASGALDYHSITVDVLKKSMNFGLIDESGS